MTVIIKWWSEENSGQCDARCYAGGETKNGCDCICGGANHGAGKQQAMIRTRAMALTWMAHRPDIVKWTVAKAVPFRQPDWGSSDRRYFASLSKHERYWKKYPGYKGGERE